MPSQIFFLTSNCLTAWQYDGRALTKMGCFVAAEAGLAEFEIYLQQLGHIPVLVLTDMVEEDFRVDSIAHAHGGDRAALLERHVSKVYRGTEYRYAQVLGRDPHSRRKDEVLFSGLLNPEFADMWLDAMRHHKLPVVGIYSLPLLTGDLVRRVCDKGKDVLFVTHNSTSGLRQSFFVGGKLRFSRLTPVSGHVEDDYAGFVRAEIGKTKRYLANLHLLGRDVVLDVCMLSGGSHLDGLERLRESETLTHYEFIPVSDVARKIGYRGPQEEYHCDGLFAFLLARSHLCNHYAKAGQRFHYQMFRARQALAALGVISVIAGMLWSGTQVVDGLLYKQEIVATTRLIEDADRRHAELQERIPQTEVEPEDMRMAVATATQLQQARRTPYRLLSRFGQAMLNQPGFEVDRIDWFVSDDRSAVAAAHESGDEDGFTSEYGDEEAPDEALTGVDMQTTYQIGILHGRVVPFEGDYGQVHARIESILDSLRKHDDVISIEALSLPLNTASSGRVLGGLGGTERKLDALFTLKLVMGGPDA